MRMFATTLENMLSIQGVLDKSMLVGAIAKDLSCGTMRMLLISWLAGWLVGPSHLNFAGLLG